MKSQSNLADVMATLKRASAMLPLPEMDAMQKKIWYERIASGEPAMTEAEFPIQEAAGLLVQLVGKIENQEIEPIQASAMTKTYIANQVGSDDWQRYHIAPERGAMYVHLACQTALAQMAKRVLDTVSIAEWGANQCPVCGGAPLFSAIQGTEGRRMLICGACLTHWRYKRIGCSFCGEENPDQLKVVQADEFPGWSAMVCHSCRGYLKSADLRQLAEEPSWQKAVLELLPLDYAVEKWMASGVPPTGN